MVRQWYSNIWKEGKYIDLWSINHILGGMVLAGIFIFFNLSLTWALILGFLITISYEIYEMLTDHFETPANKILDILTSLLGVYLMYMLKDLNLLDFNAIFASVFFIFLILEVWGFLALANR
ncbi:MAG: hypothetical protein IH845_01090 [Nanoarchaeota archaeon]|nr:hypothetical protein [Nanoarchaeota archaeon]